MLQNQNKYPQILETVILTLIPFKISDLTDITSSQIDWMIKALHVKFATEIDGKHIYALDEYMK
jgi:hypothetical protein